MHPQKQSLERWTRWAQQGSPSSHWTIALTDQWYLVLLAILTVVHFVMAAYLPPAEDELYYWAWAQHLQPSYYDHPPMVAYLIRASTAVFGNSLFGIRFFSVVFSFFLLALVGIWSPRKQVVTFFLFTPLAFFGSVLMTPDTPFLLFWALYVWWLMGVSQTFSNWSDDPVSRVYQSAPVSGWRWILGGVILGLGCLSKYSMILALPCTFLVLLTRYRFRAWFPGFALHVLIAFLFCIPILTFNYKYQFAPFLFQLAHTMGGSSAGFFTRYLGSQVALVGALPLLMLPWILFRTRDIWMYPIMHAAFLFFFIPFAFSLFQSTNNYVEANWALMSYISFWPLAQWLLAQNSISWLGLALLWLGFSPALIATLIACVHMVVPLKWVTPEKDRIAKLGSQATLAAQVVQDLKDNELTLPIFSPNYQWTASLRFYGLPEAQQLFPEGRPSNFTLQSRDACQEKRVLIFAERSEPLARAKCFANREVIREYPLTVRGKELNQYLLIEYWNE